MCISNFPEDILNLRKTHPAGPVLHLLTMILPLPTFTLVLRRPVQQTAPELPVALLLTGPLIAAMEAAAPVASLQWIKDGRTRANIIPFDGARIHTEILTVLRPGWARIL
jgi:hypothetical protein